MGSTADPRPLRYTDLFIDPQANPFGNDPQIRKNAYRGIYQRFSAGPAPLTAAGLLDHVLNLFEAKAVGGIGIFVNDTTLLPQLRVIHGIRKYPGSLMEHSSNANKAFGYLDDVVSGRGELVQVTANMFALTNEVRVHPEAQHQLELESNPDLQFTGPLTNEANPQAEKLRCRHTFFIPFKLMPHVLGKKLTPRAAYFIIQPWLAAADLRDVAEPLLTALRIGSTQVLSSTPGGGAICEIAATEPGPLFRAEANLTLYMEEKVLHRDLPGLVSVPSLVGPETAALTAAVSTLTDTHLRATQASEHRRAEDAKPATLEEVFGSLNAQRLRTLCSAKQAEDLPPVYTAWTSKKKGEKLHALFQSHVDQSARELGLQPPFVPLAALKSFQAFRFYGIDDCELGDGILPMAFAPPGGSPTARKQQLEDATAAAAYDTMVSTEGNSISFSDATTLGKAKGYIPVDWTEALLQLEGYLPVLATLIGTDHPLVRNYLSGLDRLKRIQLTLRHALKDECGGKLAPAILVYYFQIRVRCWLEDQWDSDTPVEAPSFTQEFRTFKLSRNLNWLPGISDVPALQGLRKPTTPAPSARTPARGGTGATTRGRSGQSGPSSNNNNNNTPQTRVENHNQDPRILATEGELKTRLKNWKIAKAMSSMKAKGKGPCLRNDGKEMCHSWRAKGFCYDGCRLGGGRQPALCHTAAVPLPPRKRQKRRVQNTAADWEMSHSPVELGKQCTQEHIPHNCKRRQEPVPESSPNANSQTPEESRDYTGPGTTHRRDAGGQREPADGPWEPVDKRVESPRAPHTTTEARERPLTTTYPYDRLDAHVTKAVTAFHQANCWGDFVRSVRGRGDLHPEVGELPHPAAQLLHSFQQEGTPAVMMSPPWGAARIAGALARGPHKSSHNGIEFLREEYADMMDKQQWTVLPASLVTGIPGLCLSPLGLVPQRGRRDRMISDYSYFGVNAETAPLAPAEAMQFGRALKRLLQRIHSANSRFGPVYLSKIDLSDGFYRLWVKPEDTLSLAVLFPKREGEQPLVGIPLTNPMGWCSSPPNFSACTETVADLANGILLKVGLGKMRRFPHRLDEISETPPEEAETILQPQPAETPVREASFPARKPLCYWDIYVDDFCGLVQGNQWTRRAVKRALLHSLDKVFRPLDKQDTPYRQEPASIKKLKKGDATWTTSKVILGWLIDTTTKTISLPPHRVARLQELLQAIQPTQKYAKVADWHKLLGELRSMSLALPGSLGLFSMLQEAFCHQEKGRNRLRLTRALHGFLQDFQWLAKDIASRPTRIAKLVPDLWPATIGACDAAGDGMGGVHFIPLPDGRIQPLYWRAPFPAWIRRDLVSFANPEGKITNSELELAGSIAHIDILAQAAAVGERTVHNLYDNTATVHWQRKGAATTPGPVAYLLRLQSLHQRLFRYVPRHDYIPGPANTMADTLSWAWHLSDSQLLAYFNRFFPQSLPWQSCRLRKPMYSALILAFPTPQRQAVANMICIAFFFCLRPGEYTGTTSDDQAFSLDDITFFVGTRRLSSAAASDADISAATSIQLTFTTQKNGIKGDVIAHARSTDPLCCPVTAVIRQFLLHRHHSTTFDGSVKLASFYDATRGTNVRITSTMITTTMRWHAAILQHTTGIAPASLSARSLRAGGAMALLQGQCDSNVIKLLARWHSDAMMRYLHQQSVPLFRNLASLMFNNGTYSFLPEESVPSASWKDSKFFGAEIHITAAKPNQALSTMDLNDDKGRSSGLPQTTTKKPPPQRQSRNYRSDQEEEKKSSGNEDIEVAINDGRSILSSSTTATTKTAAAAALLDQQIEGQRQKGVNNFDDNAGGKSRPDADADRAFKQKAKAARMSAVSSGAYRKPPPPGSVAAPASTAAVATARDMSDAMAKSRGRRNAGAKNQQKRPVPAHLRDSSTGGHRNGGNTGSKNQTNTTKLERLEEEVAAKARGKAPTSAGARASVTKRNPPGLSPNRSQSEASSPGSSFTAVKRMNRMEADIAAKEQSRASRGSGDRPAGKRLDRLEADVAAKERAKASRVTGKKASAIARKLAKNQQQRGAPATVPGAVSSTEGGGRAALLAKKKRNVAASVAATGTSEGAASSKLKKAPPSHGVNHLVGGEKQPKHESPDASDGGAGGPTNVPPGTGGTEVGGRYESDSNNGLAVAVAVRENEDVFIPSAVEYDPDAIKYPVYKNQRVRVYGLLFCILLIIVTACTIGVLTILQREDDEQHHVPTESPTCARCTLDYIEQLELEVGSQKLNDPESPEYLAKEWIIHEDEMQLLPTDLNFIQRFIMAAFYFDTHQVAPWRSCNQQSIDLADNETEKCDFLKLSGIKPLVFEA
ncbi:unnamed protein product, partial [Pseudo-nitzschia multistriata]